MIICPAVPQLYQSMKSLQLVLDYCPGKSAICYQTLRTVLTVQPSPDKDIEYHWRAQASMTKAGIYMLLRSEATASLP